MKNVIIYASTHQGNTKQLLDAIAKEFDVELIDATVQSEYDLSGYEVVGFASGIYHSNFHKSVIKFATTNLPKEKKIFLIYTYGKKKDYFKNFMDEITDRKARIIGYYGCEGYDNHGTAKLKGGIAKGHPDVADKALAVEFYRNLFY